MDARTFWASSPRAVHLLISHAHRARGQAAGGGRKPQRQQPKRVRLNRLPHP